jgi:hypothetical protein
MGKVVLLARPQRADAPAGAPLTDRSDEELMGLVRLDARGAFRLLVVRHAVWDARARWEPRSTFASFLYTIAFARARNHARSMSRSAAVFAPKTAEPLEGVFWRDDAGAVSEIVTRMGVPVRASGDGGP